MHDISKAFLDFIVDAVWDLAKWQLTPDVIMCQWVSAHELHLFSLYLASSKMVFFKDGEISQKNAI